MSREEQYKQFLNQNSYPRYLKRYESIPDVSSSLYVMHQGKELINFSASDYLGLARHPLLIARSQEYAKKWGVGASSSRLVTGNSSLYEKLEEQIAEAIGKPAALILGAGYQTNISVLEALLDPNVLGNKPLIFCDRYCHVSLLSMTQHLGRLQRFQHNDMQHLQVLLEKYADSEQPKFIVVESIYSMDGDQADLEKIIILAKEHRAMLYVDDAHAVGVYGKSGWGCASQYASDIDVIMGTFSKALGSFGGYIACSALLRDYLINKCRGFIYSTALSPAVLGAIAGAIELLPQLTAERQQVMQQAKKLKQFLQQENIRYGNADTHIIPWIIPDADIALRASQLLAERGILATTIRPPSVPEGSSRIRFCLSTGHSDADLAQLMQAIHEVKCLITVE